MLLNLAHTQLTKAIQQLQQGNYTQSFSSLRQSVIATHRLTGFKGSLWQHNHSFEAQNLNMTDTGHSLHLLLQAIDQRDEKLDLLSAFLADSERSFPVPQTMFPSEPLPVQDLLSKYLYRQMVLEQIVSIPYQPSVTDTSFTADEVEEELNFQFALTAYLETFIHYHQACLDFLRGIILQPLCPQTPPVLAAPLP